MPEYSGGPDGSLDSAQRPRRRARKRSALDAGLGLLARREHSVTELRTKLASRGYAPDEIGGALEELVERGLLSDQRFADAFLRSRRERGQGPLKIRAQLMQRGVRSELIDAALNGAGVDWDRCAQAARSSRFGETPPADTAQRAQQARFLQARGFSSGQVARALLAERGS